MPRVNPKQRYSPNLREGSRTGKQMALCEDESYGLARVTSNQRILVTVGGTIHLTVAAARHRTRVLDNAGRSCYVNFRVFLGNRT